MEYPHGLCREWAACLREHGALDIPVDMQCDTEASIHLQAQAVVGKHVRGKRLKPLMREYDHVVTIVGASAAIQALPQVTTESQVVAPTCSTRPPTKLLPPHAKRLHAPIITGG